jgi:hypothetical protein
LWRKSKGEGSLAEVGLESVHADNLGAASDLKKRLKNFWLLSRTL